MTIWTAENTPNGVFLPANARGRVALFYKSGSPTGLCPGQLMLIENYAGGVGRNLTHWGYGTTPIATRAQSDEEHNHAALAGRHIANYYQDWQKLIADEQAIAADCPRLGNAFVAKLKELARNKEYKLRSMPQKLEAETELEQGQGMVLDQEEKELVLKTARAMGLSPQVQGTLFDLAA